MVNFLFGRWPRLKRQKKVSRYQHRSAQRQDPSPFLLVSQRETNLKFEMSESNITTVNKLMLLNKIKDQKWNLPYSCSFSIFFKKIFGIIAVQQPWNTVNPRMNWWNILRLWDVFDFNRKKTRQNEDDHSFLDETPEAQKKLLKTPKLYWKLISLYFFWSGEIFLQKYEEHTKNL